MAIKAVERIPEADLAELWFSFRLKVWRKLLRAIKTAKESGMDQKDMAARIGMDEGQFSRVLMGRRNVTLRTMYNIARAINCRLEVEIKPLSELPKANYTYECSRPRPGYEIALDSGNDNAPRTDTGSMKVYQVS